MDISNDMGGHKNLLVTLSRMLIVRVHIRCWRKPLLAYDPRYMDIIVD